MASLPFSTRLRALPVLDRWPLLLDGVPIGSITPDLFDEIHERSLPCGAPSWVRGSWRGEPACCLERPGLRGPHSEAPQADPDADLHLLARTLQQAGLAGRWRGERVALRDVDGHRLGSIERAVVRTLGIETWAVHLLGVTPDGRMWVQQRAMDKADDPGMWDTLVGGMVPDGETFPGALARETMEEAGLDLAALHDVRWAFSLHSCRPSAHAGGRGWLVERLDAYRAVVPPGQVPVNRDGEVARFACMDSGELQNGLEVGCFTDDAAAMLEMIDAGTGLARQE